MSHFVVKTATLHSAAVATADGAIMDVRGCSYVTVQIVGITTATVTFKARQDGSNYVAVVGKNLNSGVEATTATADGLYSVAIHGCTEFIADITAWTAGTITITAVAGQGGVVMNHTSVAAVVGAIDTELPTAAALADNASNPTAPAVGAFGMVWDGATWDRLPGTSTAGAKVQPATGGAGAVDATTSRTTLASDDPAVVALQVIDDWDESDRAKVNPVVGQAGVAAGSGAVGATTQRVVLATDDPAVTALQIVDDWDESDRAKVNPIAGQAGVAAGAGAVDALTQRTTLASNDPAVTALQIMDDWDNAASDGASVSGDVAHGATNAGEPLQLGGEAIAHGTNPTAVTAGQRTKFYANRAGIPFVIGGHPNVVTRTAIITDADGAQTDASLVTVGSGTKIVVTRVTVAADNDNTDDINVKIGFGTATLPADAAGGANGILAHHPGVPAGGGFTVGDGSGILGVGADNEDLRLTCADPVGGSVAITVSYYTVES